MTTQTTTGLWLVIRKAAIDLLRESIDPAKEIACAMSADIVADFVVSGDPAPGGSKTFIPMRYGDGRVIMKATDGGRERPAGRMVDAGKGNARWKKQVAACARAAYCDQPVGEPVAFAMTFWRRRPQNHYGTGRNAGKLKPWAVDLLPCSVPDVTKLIRSTEDALTGIVWKDDAQIVDQFAFRRYAETPGARIVVWRIM